MIKLRWPWMTRAERHSHIAEAMRGRPNIGFWGIQRGTRLMRSTVHYDLIDMEAAGLVTRTAATVNGQEAITYNLTPS